MDVDPQQQQQQQLNAQSTPSSHLREPEPTPSPAPKPRVISTLQCNYSNTQLAAAAAALDRAGRPATGPKSTAAPHELGLVTKDGKPMPLQAVQVRAQLLDLVAKVVVLQQYEPRRGHG